MRRKTVSVVVALFMIQWFPLYAAFGQPISDSEIREELNALKERVRRLEEVLEKKDREIDELKNKTDQDEGRPSVGEGVEPEDEGLLTVLKKRIRFSGLIEAGGAWERIEDADGDDTSQSDLNLTTFELGIEAEINRWAQVAAVFLYEDATFGEETSVDLDLATVTLGNPEIFPLYLTAGAMYVPFGALLTHFPDDPLIDQPLTLLFGETREKAALIGCSAGNLRLSGYVFNGDMDEFGGEDHVEHYGLDAHYDYENGHIGFLAGASYISNLADSDGLTDELNGLGINNIQEEIGGLAAYLHFAFSGYFIGLEYMTAIDDFRPSELSTAGGGGARPLVWNIEGGYNLNWGKNLEIALKYAGSDETEGLGFPERRYGIAFNQEIFECIIGSVAYLHDEFHEDDRDGRDARDIVFGQLAVAF